MNTYRVLVEVEDHIHRDGGTINLPTQWVEANSESSAAAKIGMKMLAEYGGWEPDDIVHTLVVLETN